MLRLGPLVLVLAALSCGPEIPRTQRPPVVFAVFDPAKGELPTPNDLALDASGKVAISPNAALSDSENALKASMNGRDGFSTASGARVQFSAELEPSSVSASAVLGFDLGARGAGPATEVKLDRVYAACDRSVTLSSATGFAPGHTYLFAVRGGAAGVRGLRGEEVVATPAFYFLRAGKDLTLHPDAMPGASRAEKRATAERLEAVRQKLEPLVRTVELAGVPRGELAAVWAFTVHTLPEALVDPASRRVPFPNDLLKDASTGLVSLPVDPAESALQQELKRNFNTLDGFSTTAALSLEATVAIDPATVTAGTVRLFQEDGAEVTALTRAVAEGGKKLVLTPTGALASATRHVVVTVGVKDVQGRPLEAMPLASVLALPWPLVDDQGVSRLSNFCDATAQRLEPLRAAVARVVAAAGLPRSELSSAWVFTTQDVARRARALWLTPYREALPLEVLDAKRDAPGLTQPNLAKVVTGKLWTYDRLDPTTRAFRPDGKGVHRPIPFVLTLPKGVSAGGKAKVVVFGHGLYTERRLVLLLADRLARAGFAAMAIDFPLHGERSVCAQDSHCQLGSGCSPDGLCRKDGQLTDFARMVSIPGVPGEGTPTSTGTFFADTESLTGTRDHFRQAIIDLSAQTRLIRNLDWSTVTGGVGLDPDELSWVGISLGGILGAAFSGIDPGLRATLMNVPGAGLVQLMAESQTFKAQLDKSLADKGLTKGTAGYDAFVNAAKWTLDEVDPINLAPFARRLPLVWENPQTGKLEVAPKKALRIQMAQGDTVVPNSCTALLVTAAGVDKDTEFRAFLGTHGFLADPVEAIAMTQGQDDMAAFLEQN